MADALYRKRKASTLGIYSPRSIHVLTRYPSGLWEKPLAKPGNFAPVTLKENRHRWKGKTPLVVREFQSLKKSLGGRWAIGLEGEGKISRIHGVAEGPAFFGENPLQILSRSLSGGGKQPMKGTSWTLAKKDRTPTEPSYLELDIQNAT